MTRIFYEKYWKNQDVLDDFGYKWPVIQKLLPTDSRLNFLDFGCGKGTILKEIAAIRPKFCLYGTDISGSALMIAKRRIAQGVFRLLKADQRIPFSGSFFDYVLAADVLEHVEDTSTAFRELARVLKKGGKLLVTTPYNGKLKVILATLLAFEKYFDPHSPHIRFFSPRSLRQCLSEADFRPQKFGYFGRFYPLSRAMFAVSEKQSAPERKKQIGSSCGRILR